MKVSPLAGKLPEPGMLVNVPKLITAYYKTYVESFRGTDHLKRILDEAQTIVSDAVA